MINTTTWTTTVKPSRIGMPISARVTGHQCAQSQVGMAIVRDRAALVTGVFPGPVAWSPPS